MDYMENEYIGTIMDKLGLNHGAPQEAKNRNNSIIEEYQESNNKLEYLRQELRIQSPRDIHFFDKLLSENRLGKNLEERIEEMADKPRHEVRDESDKLWEDDGYRTLSRLKNNTF